MYTYYLYEYVKDTELCSTALNIRNLILLLNQLLFFFSFRSVFENTDSVLKTATRWTGSKDYSRL